MVISGCHADRYATFISAAVQDNLAHVKARKRIAVNSFIDKKVLPAAVNGAAAIKLQERRDCCYVIASQPQDGTWMIFASDCAKIHWLFSRHVWQYA